MTDDEGYTRVIREGSESWETRKLVEPRPPSRPPLGSRLEQNSHRVAMATNET